MRIRVKVNKGEQELEVKPHDTLLTVIRDYLGLLGTKKGCDSGGCGACTIIINGKSVYSCMYPAIKADGKEIITIEGLELNGELSRVQKAFIDADSVQCGYCIPGAIMSAYALINEKLSPTEEDIEEAFSGNLCRCSAGYTWKKAVELALKSEKQREF